MSLRTSQKMSAQGASEAIANYSYSLCIVCDCFVSSNDINFIICPSPLFKYHKHRQHDQAEA
jgi:hypothetical protein